MSIRRFHLFLVALFLTACAPISAPTPSDPAATPGAANDWYAVYFSQPDGPNAASLRGGPDAALAAAIDQARLSVDAALYDLDLWSIRDALLDAYYRGVNVRVVVESDNIDREEIQALIEAGIEVLGDRREALMHNKFVVIDRLEVWTGSMNFTLNGAYRNNNNLIRVRSSRLAENYLDEFEEMFTLDLFSQAIQADTPYPSLTINGVEVETYFSPDDGVQSRLVALIDSAEESVYVMAFAFTADPLRDALLRANQRGVTVAGIIEQDQADNPGSDFEDLRAAGLTFVLDGNPHNMHHKVMIIDRQIVVTGSYNFSRSAEERNDENLLVIHSPEIAALYLAEFAGLLPVE